MKKLLLLLAMCLVFINLPAMAEDDENPAIEKEVKVDVDEITLRPALEIEQAVMEYMLAFEAYQSARRAKDPEVRGKMVQYMKQYREAYARFLSMMREDKLYEPQKPKNPAGRYNRKHEKEKGVKRQWDNSSARETRSKIRKMVESGASPEEIRSAIKVSLPTAPRSIDPSTCVTSCGPDGSGGSNETINPRTVDVDKDGGNIRPDDGDDRTRHFPRRH